MPFTMDRYKRYRSMKMHHQPTPITASKDSNGQLTGGQNMPSSTSSSSEDDDVISSAIGEFGRWQLQLTFLLSLFNIPCTWHIFAPTFHAVQGDFWCSRPHHLEHNVASADWVRYSQPNGPCSIYDMDYSHTTASDVVELNYPPSFDQNKTTKLCTHWEWEHGTTIISQWELVCDRKELINVAEMMFLGGVALGGLVSGIISDKYGRKRTLMMSVTLQTIIGTSIAFVPWLGLYLVLRAFLGFISVSVVFSGFVLALELVGGHWRTVAGVSYLFPVPLSYITIAGIAWLLRDWRELQLAVSLPGLLFLGLYWVLPESPRWLLAMGRKSEVLTILQKAAFMNRRELPENIDKQLQPPPKGEDEKSAGIMDLFRTRAMRKNTLLLFVIWFSVYLVYYGLVLNIANIGGDLYFNSVLSGLVEIPAIAVSILFLHRGGRRWPLCLTLALAGTACLLTLFVPSSTLSPSAATSSLLDSSSSPTSTLSSLTSAALVMASNSTLGSASTDDSSGAAMSLVATEESSETGTSNLQWLTTSLAMLGKFSVSSSNAVMPVFTAELFPTVIRNLGVGASNVSAGIALMLVPYLWMLSAMDVRVPMGVLGACGVIGGLCVLFLPETGNKPLAGTLTEQQNSGAGSASPSSSSRQIQEEVYTATEGKSNTICDNVI